MSSAEMPGGTESTGAHAGRAIAQRRFRQRIGFVLVALGAAVVIGADYLLGATEFFTIPRIAGFTLVACGVLVQGWVVLSRRAPDGPSS